MKNVLYWFKNNLRLKDNPSLQHALEKSDRVCLVYIIEDRLLGRHPLGFDAMGDYREQFLYQSLKSLSEEIIKLGGKLVIRSGDPVEEILRLATEFKAEEIVTSLDPGDYERSWDEEIANKYKLTAIDDGSLYSQEDLPFSYLDLPMSFTAFRKKVEKRAKVRTEVGPPSDLSKGFHKLDMENLNNSSLNVDERSAFPYEGGEVSAWKRIENYIWLRQRIKSYKKTRNGLVGTEYSSKFSPWLANGSISPVSIYHQIRKYESEVVSNMSTYWLYFEILWRDYFRHVGFKFRETIFHLSGIRNIPIDMNQDQNLFNKWIAGNTDDAFVNANMNELAGTGFMSNRGRQNVASYLIHDLGVDWRWGATYFESQLVDYDTCSNWGNWMYIAGVGNSRQPQVFDTKKQACMYDRDKKYTRLWSGE